MFESNMLPALIALHPVVIVLLVILGVAIVALIVLSIVGRKMQKKQNESEAAMEQASQTASIVVIDKKRMKLKESGLPQIVLDQTPRYMRGTKVPVVKAKVGPKVMTLMCDASIYDLIPVKKEVKANGLKGEIKIYLNAEQRAAYYTVDGQGSDDFKVDLTTLAE